MQVFCLVILRDKSRPYPSIYCLPRVDVSTKREELPKMLAALVLVPTATVGEFRRVGFSVHMLESAFGGCEKMVVTTSFSQVGHEQNFCKRKTTEYS
jgi:hypothetical protein